MCVYPIAHKSEVLTKFKGWEAAVTNQADCKIKTLRTDNGGEYMSTDFQNYLKEKRIRHETTVPHSPQQNGVAERMNRTLQEAALSMILHAEVAKRFWGKQGVPRHTSEIELSQPRQESLRTSDGMVRNRTSQISAFFVALPTLT